MSRAMNDNPPGAIPGPSVKTMVERLKLSEDNARTLKGMMAGTIRCFCIYIFLLNFLHAPLYTPEMLAAEDREQQHWFGSIRRPTIGSLQHLFFKESATGWATETYLTSVLVAPVSSAVEAKNEGKVAKRTERVNAVIDAVRPWK